MTKKIVTLAGDGIGPEIMDAGLKVLEAVAKKTGFDYEIDAQPFGGAAIDVFGEPLPAKTLNAAKNADAVLLAAIGAPKYENAKIRPEQGLLAIRKELGLFANIRPIRVHPALSHLSPLKVDKVKGIDFVIVRELTGGIYFGEPRVLEAEHAVDTNVYSADEIRRIATYAFELARTRRRKVTSVDKQNVLATSKLWRNVVEDVHKNYPDVTLEHQLVDSCAMILITDPKRFDVIVTENLFGDILSDEASVLPGSLGLMPSASHGARKGSAGGGNPSLYEPIHGSAPDIAGKGIANPLAMILSVAMMLGQSFGDLTAQKLIESATDSVLTSGILTPDLGGNASTEEVTGAVVQWLMSKE
ncbi:MAG: 3-isopropylmalate dehydrogenase [Bifidobacteriaceae bacterium]|jgi:3-isopropylmalate dehydrogenase|nr:3-isopropylmalate dehydrogenase [Bifidobacteriaceae bacterium]